MAMNGDFSLRRVSIHTDGSCLGNPGPGGYGIILEHEGHEKELSGGFRRTTNNRMEILAVIIGLEALMERCCVTVYSDSRYVVDAVEVLDLEVPDVLVFRGHGDANKRLAGSWLSRMPYQKRNL